MFSREDWTLFRNLNTIAQKAGVPLQHLRRLVLKELVDNALDECGDCTFGKTDANTYWVKDESSGIPLDADGIAELFSINRPLTSSKILRLPSRGALGNGLRVVVGAALASGGEIKVATNGHFYWIGFNDQTGKSHIEATEKSNITKGTQIWVTLGDSVPRDDQEEAWARSAAVLKTASRYKGKSSPYWYDSDSFFELVRAAGDKTTSWLAAQFGLAQDGVGSKKCRDITREESEVLLHEMRKVTNKVDAKKIGKGDFGCVKYGEVRIAPGRGETCALLPYVVEAVALPVNEDMRQDKDSEDHILAFVNATPITGKLDIHREKSTSIALFGCGLQHRISGVAKRKFNLMLNITIPYMPITTDGKEPNFKYFLSDIASVAQKATRKLKSSLKKSSGGIRDIIIDRLRVAVAKVSDGGGYRYSLRQLFYAIRPYILDNPELGDLDYNYFSRVIGEHESKYGELKGMYRDPRGTLYTPHTKETIPIGTISVESYRRPDWTFNKILYIEKEGLFEVLKQVGFPERFDCALLSSKGYASRAVRDVIDLLGETGEPIQFFCIHDADGPGTMIYQSLQEGTTARGRRNVEIVNLGLDPWEAVAMGLQKEEFAARSGKTPVAEYVIEHERMDERDHGGRWWKDWLQTKRVELNSMTSPEFVEWLEKKMAKYHVGKVVPPEETLRERMKAMAEQLVREDLTFKILAQHNFETLVSAEMHNVGAKIGKLKLHSAINKTLNEDRVQTWTKPLEAEARKILGDNE